VKEFRRRLPHFHQEGRWHFVTWHLAGSLPANLYPPKDKANAGAAFIWMDRYLDTRTDGPMAIANGQVAQAVLNVLLLGRRQSRYEIGPFVIMANHVHMLVRTSGDMSTEMKWIKGASARAANLLLHATVSPFWQRESYDRLVRSQEEFERISRYIEWNPVKAGLTDSPEKWRWSSANPAVCCLGGDGLVTPAARHSGLRT